MLVDDNASATQALNQIRDGDVLIGWAINVVRS
jgi:hypothetical protein